MKRLLPILLTVAMLTMIMAIPATAESPEIERSFVYYNNVTEKDATYTLSYDEAAFETGTIYHHQLMQTSLRFAMAAAKGTPENVISLFNTLGFAYTDTSIHYPTPAFDYDAGTTTIGYAIGSKNATDKEGDYTLIAVAVRGNGYADEWGSNFEIGDGSRHRGFEKSAKQVTDGIMEYIESQIPADTRVKFWITGFSRGAAVANVTAHNLNTAILDGTLSALPDDVFAYTFESPRTVTTDEPGFDGDKNIFNIVNPTDLVTQIPPAEWGYVRYGVDCPLPDDESCEDYAALKAREVKEFKKILTAAGVGNAEETASVRSSTIENQTSKNISFINDLAATFGDHASYATNSERDLCNLIVSALGENGNLLALLINNPFPDSLSVIMGYMANLETILYAHYPELELAWVDALTSSELAPPSPTSPSKPTVLLGDANADGAVNLKDVLTMRKYLSDTPVNIDLVAGDTNSDDVVNMKDVLTLRKYLADIIDKIG